MFGSFFRPLLAAGLVASAIGGCSGDDLLGSDSADISGERSWKLSPDAIAAGRVVRVAYDAAPAWRGQAACSGSLREGTRVLGEFLSDRYAAIDTVGGYACRRNTADSSRMSVHGTGRALDLMIPKRGGAPDSARGDIIANWLVVNAQRIGVQLIIWNRTVWRSNGSNADSYSGPHPHDDHIHVEITNTAARKGTPWFASMDEGDAGSMDASRLVDGAIDDDEDASTTAPKPDATAPLPPKDAGTKDSGSVTPTVDASRPQEPTPVDAGTGSTTEDDEPEMQGQPGSLEPDEADPGGSADGYDFEVPEGEAAPDDALGPQSRRRAPSASDDEATESKGCSAAPITTTRGTSFAIFGALGIALALTRRSKRS
jgi:hypothetical protein